MRCLLWRNWFFWAVNWWRLWFACLTFPLECRLPRNLKSKVYKSQLSLSSLTSVLPLLSQRNREPPEHYSCFLLFTPYPLPHQICHTSYIYHKPLQRKINQKREVGSARRRVGGQWKFHQEAISTCTSLFVFVCLPLLECKLHKGRDLCLLPSSLLIYPQPLAHAWHTGHVQ